MRQCDLAALSTAGAVALAGSVAFASIAPPQIQIEPRILEARLGTDACFMLETTEVPPEATDRSYSVDGIPAGTGSCLSLHALDQGPGFFLDQLCVDLGCSTKSSGSFLVDIGVTLLDSSGNTVGQAEDSATLNILPECEQLDVDGGLQPTQGVWQDDIVFDDRQGKQLRRNSEASTPTEAVFEAEIEMAKRRPTVLGGIRLDLHNVIFVNGKTRGTTNVPVRLRFTLFESDGSSRVLFTSDVTDEIPLDGPCGEPQDFFTGLVAIEGVPPADQGAFTFEQTGRYRIEAEVVRESGDPTGIRVAVEGETVETHPIRTRFVPLRINPPAATPEESAHLFAATELLRARSQTFVPDLLPVPMPGGFIGDPSFFIRDRSTLFDEARDVIDEVLSTRFVDREGIDDADLNRLKATAKAASALLAREISLEGLFTPSPMRIAVVMLNTEIDFLLPLDSFNGVTVTNKLFYVRAPALGQDEPLLYETVAHEIVHSTEVGFWNGGSMLRDCDLDYHNRGLEVADGLRLTRGGVEDRSRQKDLRGIMESRVGERWTSQCTWKQMVTALQQPLDPPVLLVQGYVTNEGTAILGFLEPIYHIDGVVDLADGSPGAFALVLRDDADTELGHFGFDVDFTRQGIAPSNFEAFAWRLPDLPEVARVELRGDEDALLFAVDMSPNTPTVEILDPAGGENVTAPSAGCVPVRWSGADVDGDDLLYTVQYSADAGETWEGRAIEIDAHILDVRVDPDASEHRVRVIVTDGSRSSEADVTFTADFSSAPAATDTCRCDLDADGDGSVSVATDIVYMARHLLALSPVPPSFRDSDPGIPADDLLADRIDAARTRLDADDSGDLSVATDIVYMARHLLGLTPVPASFRDSDPTIPGDPEIAERVDRLCP